MARDSHGRPECGSKQPTAAGGMAAVRLVTVDAERAGQRLDNFLLGQLKGAPRTLVYRIIRSGEVRINGGRAKPDSRLDAGDRVRIPPVRLAGDSSPAIPRPEAADFLVDAIVFEDDQLLVLNKPSGLASHGGSGIRHGAIELLRALRPSQSLELVHRLDRDTSGLLLIAKKRAALTSLQALMRESDGIEKRYLTLLVGRLPGGSMEVDLPLRKATLQGGERMVRVDDQGKASYTRFALLERRGGHTFCEATIATGRTHQIRVHAAHIGLPVAGDDKYGDREANRKLRERAGLKRLFLHAARLEFSLDGGRRPYLLSAPLPTDLAEVLDRLV
ncbi:MAG TPA: 23S rRNA pseudouridine(955/2504/2580) synthase [Xanthomonadales bacterium]|nr:23S rRNA pseudouridine(955/2504/2580) synthase [Xanthomonadales bacterium]